MTSFVVSPPGGAAELEAFVPVHRRTYFMTPEDGQAWAEWVPAENVRIVRSGETMVGGATLVPMGQWFGGRSVRMVGISAVGVEPAARASGAGSALMSEILRELHSKGVPISSLYPATHTVYRRLGYELAGSYIRYRLQTDHVDVRDRSLDIEISSDREAVAGVYDTGARRTSGLLDRTEHMWKRTFEPWKQEDPQIYLVRGKAGDEGYVVFHRTEGESMRHHLQATIVALTAAAARRILTLVADHRSFTESINWCGPPADPLRFALSEPRTTVTQSWPWMLRITDVASALTERGYPSMVEAELHLSVDDSLLEGNNGSFVLRVAGGKGEVERGGKGSLRLDVRGLASMYTGYASPHELLATGYIEGSDEDLSTAASLFAGPAPWLADFF